MALLFKCGFIVKKSLTLATAPPSPLPTARICFVRFGFFIKKSLSGFFELENFIYPSRHPHPPTEKIIHLCIILWILVQSYTVSDLILFGGHCYLYIMVQRFCLVSMTISYRKTPYRSLKQAAGSTSCPWTTILMLWFPLISTKGILPSTIVTVA